MCKSESEDCEDPLLEVLTLDSCFCVCRDPLLELGTFVVSVLRVGVDPLLELGVLEVSDLGAVFELVLELVLGCGVSVRDLFVWDCCVADSAPRVLEPAD